ncbi:MAG: Lrp/AsnC ligand binding domain-containing protein [Thermoplasmatota archaeon]|nr:Lrp/AsnC ligand binding domain-containing protein [Candidatus Thermoplasmatota archaeon]MBU1914873.1 Lrp/AsnC ligand binding domain-containing protein [Candidatus Thermoplasmatota archaeon]
MVKAVVLVMLEQQTFEDAMKINKIPGVVDGYLVFGHYDYIAFIDVPALEKVGQIADRIQKLGFVRYVETLIER